MAVTHGGWARRISVGHVALALPLVAAVIASRLPIRDNSYLWHVRAGTLQIEQGSVLTTDPFSFTATGQPWRTQSWLADLAYGWADNLWGLNTVGPLVLFGSVILIAAITIRARTVLPSAMPVALGTIWVMWLTLGYFTPRPVLYSLVLLAIFLVAADSPRLRWTLPLLMWLWATIHGGFVVGIGYLVLDGLRRRDRQRLVDVLVVTIVTTLTAHGWATWEVVLKFLGSGEALDLIVEWGTPDFISLQLAPFGLAIVALLFVANAGKLEQRDLWVIIPFLLFAFTANRSVPIAALVLAPWYLRVLAGVQVGRGQSASAPQGFINGALILAVLAVPWLIPIDGGIDERRFALSAVPHLNSEGVFHDDAVGGYLIYKEWPQRLVFIDDRAELYGDTYVDFVNARGGKPVWESLFEEHEIEQALLRREDPLYQILLASGWRESYRDEIFVVMTKSPNLG